MALQYHLKVDDGDVAPRYTIAHNIFKELRNIAVDPKRRRRHIGSRLLIHQARCAADHGFRNLTLEVRVSNVAAQSLYQRFGFESAGVRVRYYENTEDAIVMWCHQIRTDEYRASLRTLCPEVGR